MTADLRELTSWVPDGTDPSAHYDRVTSAWQYLLGENLHYGVFATGEEPLDVATDALTLRMAEEVGLGADSRVLDVGCGTGAPACFLAERFHCRVLGISTSAVGIERARARAEQRGLGALVSFTIADGMANGLGDRSFDRVWVMESSHLMPSKPRLLAECARVSKPGGKIVLCDITLRREIAKSDVGGIRDELLLLRDVFGRAKMESLEWYEREMSRQGFERIRKVDLSRATLPTFDRWEENAAKSRDQCVRLFGERSWKQFVESARVLRRFWNEGILGYGLIAAERPAS